MLCWKAHLNRTGAQLEGPKKILRQYMRGHVAFNDPGLIMALGDLIDVAEETNDWNKERM